MKASEIYRLPTEREESWDSMPDDLIGAVFNLDIYNTYDVDDPDSPLRGHRKLEINLEPDYHWLSIYALEFAGQAFAVVSRSATEKSGNDHEVLITDKGLYEKARAHVISHVFGKIDQDLFGDAEDEIEWDLHGAVIAKFPDGYRLAMRSEVGFGSKEPAFDKDKLDKDHRAKIWTLDGDKAGRGLRSEAGVALAKEVIDGAILRGRRTLVGKWVHDTDWFAGFYEADGIVYDMHASSYTLSGDAMNWDTHFRVGYLCHGKFYEVLDRCVRTGDIDLSDPAVADVRDAFDLTEEETVSVVKSVAGGRKSDFVVAAVELLMERDVVPAKFAELDHAVFGQARVLAEDNGMVRFGLGDMQSISYAEDYWKRCQANLTKRAEERLAANAPAEEAHKPQP